MYYVFRFLSFLLSIFFAYACFIVYENGIQKFQILVFIVLSISLFFYSIFGKTIVEYIKN